MPIASPVIVALDYPDAAQALAMADQLDPTRVRVKVGKEIFTRSGPAIVEGLHKKGFELFLDLKFHDIPNTVAGAVSAAADMGVWMAKRSGMDGVVCSAQEASMLKAACGQQFELVTPGIRPAGADAGDQRRVLTPVQARDAGVDYMVIGRPITQAAEPTAVVDEILQSLA